jgi:hypothetical protein
MDEVMKGEQVAGILEALTPEVEACAARRLNMLLGVVPLWAMTQEEADWVFRARMRMAGGE